MPTSIAKLTFSADQVTVEKVGVEVRGLAVYRIADPLLAFRMIDVDRSSLTEILRDMFVGATRRIVARLTLDECITHRKDLVAQALMGEIAPILAGEGEHARHRTTAGWGVVLDTIEIQDVRVLSQEVFGRLQAPYREKLALEALVAENGVKQERARLDAERRRVEEQSRRELMAEEEARFVVERRRAEEARQHEDELAQQRLEAELARQRARPRPTASAPRSSSRRSARPARPTPRSCGSRAPRTRTSARRASARCSSRETMPELARAFRGSFDRVNVTSTNGSEMFGFLTAGLDQVLSVAREHGARDPEKLDPRPKR